MAKTSGLLKKNILAIDVGNTSIFYAYYSGGRLKKTRRVRTERFKMAAIPTIRKRFPLKKIEIVILASVVPNVGRFLAKKIPQTLRLKTWVVGQDVLVPIKNRYKNPKQVGIDRLLNALAAFEKHQKEAIIIDFGTAITFDVVSKRGEYLGGVIAPGIEISLDALFERTALLPHTRLAHPSRIIGRDTVESIRSGCSHGIGGLCDRIVEKIKTHYSLKPIVIATGGYAKFMSNYCRVIDEIDPFLTMTGMLCAYKKTLDKI